MVLKKYWLIGLIGITILIAGTLVGYTFFFKSKAPPRFGYHALKINGQFVNPEIFLKEKNKFFMRWRRNAEMMRKNEEERTDALLDEIINQMVMDNYLYHHSGIAVTHEEVDEYINRYIKSKFSSPSDFNSFLHDANYKSKDDFQKGIEQYLFKLKCFPKIAKDMGLAIPPAVLDSLYQKHIDENPEFYHPKTEFADMILMEKFGTSEMFKTWIEGIKSKSSIQILDPGMRAYRLYRDGRYKEAGALYEKLFRKWQKEIHLQRAIESYQMAKNWTKVIRLSRVAVQKYPQKISYSLNKAEALYWKGRVNEALNVLRNAESRMQGSVYCRESIIQTYAKLGLAKEAERVKNTFSQ